MPLAPLATVVPMAERSYFTVAWVGEVSVTESTLDVTADASGLDVKELSAAENSEPFWSSSTRLLFGVDGLKNAFQLVVIAAMVAADPLLEELALLAGAAGADVDGGAEVAGGALEDELELLEQADIAATSTRPSAGAR